MFAHLAYACKISWLMALAVPEGLSFLPMMRFDRRKRHSLETVERELRHISRFAERDKFQWKNWEHKGSFPRACATRLCAAVSGFPILSSQ